jgi:hypothetical protein
MLGGRKESLRDQHGLHPNDYCEVEREIHCASGESATITWALR